jgi:hypothetical protein
MSSRETKTEEDIQRHQQHQDNAAQLSHPMEKAIEVGAVQSARILEES